MKYARYIELGFTSKETIINNSCVQFPNLEYEKMTSVLVIIIFD